MKIKTINASIITLALAVTTMAAYAMEKDTIYSMPADAKHEQYYLPNEAQPEKGSVADAAQCLKACEGADACVVWTFKPGRFGSPNSCKLSPKLMQEQGITTPFSGAASGVMESR
ncbi:hypothetical protein [Marinicella rhabdoformis]|uniref:hypothetical protein n=1 Tax=Marinicella rhabdoformis TaxID=2580566 RepID=UPI0012AECFA1|nr:hypothetical protein [Marinicella rhabdoformis]